MARTTRKGPWAGSWIRTALFAGALALALAGTGRAMAQTTLHVDASLAAGGDGLTWAGAMNDLESALQAAASQGGVNEIRLAGGLYTPTRRLDPADPRSATFQLLDGLTLRGGYAGSANSDPDHWDPALYVTTLTGDLNGNDFGIIGADNAYHVVVFDDLDGTATIAGLRITGGNANITDTDEIGLRTDLGGGAIAWLCTLIMDRCVFTGNFAEYGGGAYIREREAQITNCVFENNSASESACALRLYQCTVANIIDCAFRGNTFDEDVKAASNTVAAYNANFTLRGCILENNSTPYGSGTIFTSHNSTEAVRVENSTFYGNRSGVGGAILAYGRTQIVSCVFRDNVAEIAGGAVKAGNNSTIDGCIFERNTAEWFGGGAILVDDTELTISDSIVANNHGPTGGGIFTSGPLTLRNCTILNNQNNGVTIFSNGGSLDAANTIFWGNSPGQVVMDSGSLPPGKPLLGGEAVATLTNCAVEGGWLGAGSGNIGVNPNFVQPGCGDFHLTADSPCLNSGSTSMATSLVDLDGEPRIQDGVVDMGAYEGVSPPQTPVACASNIQAGEFTYLVPEGGAFEPFDHAGAWLIAFPGHPDASATLEQSSLLLHPASGGYSEIGDIMRLDTTLPPTQLWTQMVVPFEGENLGLLDFDDLHLTVFDPDSGLWKLAVEANVTISPGHSGPVGDRSITMADDGPYQLSLEYGDYGVVWSATEGRGFVWAILDRHNEFGIGAPLPACAADCAAPNDGVVDHSDVFPLLAAWGVVPPGVPADVNGDLLVDVNDLLAVIVAWGPCP